MLVKAYGKASFEVKIMMKLVNAKNQRKPELNQEVQDPSKRAFLMAVRDGVKIAAVTFIFGGSLLETIGCASRGASNQKAKAEASLNSELFEMTSIRKREMTEEESGREGVIGITMGLRQTMYEGMKITNIVVGGISNVNLGGSTGQGIGFGSGATGTKRTTDIIIRKNVGAQVPLLIPDPANMATDADGLVAMNVQITGVNGAGQDISQSAMLKVPANFGQ